MLHPIMSPERKHTPCVSLRSRNACQDFTRGILYRNLQEKCWGPEGAPSSSTGLYTYRKNPSVRTHCLGNLLSRTQNITFAGAHVGTLDNLYMDLYIDNQINYRNIYILVVKRTKYLCHLKQRSPRMVLFSPQAAHSLQRVAPTPVNQRANLAVQ